MYRRSTRQRLALAALLAATATVVTLDFRENPGGPIQRVQNLAISVVAPLQDGIGRVFAPAGDFLSSLRQMGTLKRENERLAAELEQLKAQQRRIPEIMRENAHLKQLVKQKDWVTGATLYTRVIGTGPSNNEWSVFVDKGQADGLKVGMAVVSEQGLVGRTLFVAERYSKILLAIDPQHSVGARLTGSGEQGVIGGEGAADLRFEFIDPSTKIANGETVVTSGYDKGIYPAGIPIGRVTRVNEAPDGLTKTALVRPMVDFSRLDTVVVLLESGPMIPGS
ncbi:MAG: rod shape-determining protein MreC [Actinomycetota bacterium]|nr:rod shape-determining protein MreC [Actinomycetota bacterium]